MKKPSSTRRLCAILGVSLFAVLSMRDMVTAQTDESFYTQVSRTVFRLEFIETTLRHGQQKPQTKLISAGTAFVIRHNGKRFLVTARHVVDKDYDLRARVPARQKATKQTQIIELQIPKAAWLFHSLGPSSGAAQDSRFTGVDVAVTPLPDQEDHEVSNFGSCKPCREGETSQLAIADPEPPRHVLIAGFPLDFASELSEQRPMVRSGVIAFTAGVRFLRVGDALADERSLIVDRRLQGGFSGSPVFSIDARGNITLQGLVIASNAVADYTVVEPASRIRETIEQCIATPPTPNAPSAG